VLQDLESHALEGCGAEDARIGVFEHAQDGVALRLHPPVEQGQDLRLAGPDDGRLR
jgi:hypothetical protein